MFCLNFTDEQENIVENKTATNSSVLEVLGTRDRSHIHNALRLSDPGSSESKLRFP